MSTDLELAVKEGRSWTVSITQESYKIEVKETQWVKLDEGKTGFTPQVAELIKKGSVVFQQTFEGDLDRETLIRIIGAANAFGTQPEALL